jgi:hypothetical protein
LQLGKKLTALDLDVAELAIQWKVLKVHRTVGGYGQAERQERDKGVEFDP